MTRKSESTTENAKRSISRSKVILQYTAQALQTNDIISDPKSSLPGKFLTVRRSDTMQLPVQPDIGILEYQRELNATERF